MLLSARREGFSLHTIKKRKSKKKPLITKGYNENK